MVLNSATARTAKTHTLSASAFLALAEGQGSADVVKFLWMVERSRRLLMVKGMLEHAERKPHLLGPLRGTDAVWSAFSHAQRVEPSAVDSVLLHPQVGTALSFGLRRLAAAEARQGPLWVDLGLVHTLALAVAARANLSWQTLVPLRDGTVMLPCLGMARFRAASRWDLAKAGTESGRIWLERGTERVRVPDDPSTNASGWWGLGRLCVNDAPTLQVWLDDLDPFRDLADPVGPARLDDAAIQRWRELLVEAWHIIRGDQPDLAEALAAGVVSLVPLPAADGWDTRSASTGEAFGSVMVSPPPDSTSLAVSLVHEFQHIKLGALIHLVPLTRADEAACLYAPWRDDPRPLGGLIQGAYAFLGIATFWRVRRKNLTGAEAQLAAFEYAYARDQTLEALGILRSSDTLTAFGREFLDRAHEHIVPWLDDEISSAVQYLVAIATGGHRAGWRIRHARPDPDDVAALTDAWLAGRAVSGSIAPSTVMSQPVLNWSQGRLGLIRRRIVAPDRYRDVLDAVPWAASLTEADLALVGADTSAARDGYLARIAAEPACLDAWTGLGLALAADGSPGARALTNRPEIVLAVHTALREKASPVALAAWLDAASNPS